jgi:PST family polysaccharide transporter
MNRKLWENLASLYGVHAFNYLIPLFTLPYLARVLGPEQWGALAFADAYARFVTLAIEYGFGLSATREIARIRDDAHARGRQLAGVFGAQLLLGAAALLVTVVLARCMPIFASHRWLLPGAFFLAMGQGVAPMWYFQGIERVRLMGALWIFGRIAGAIGLLLFVRSQDDGPLALFILGTAPFLYLIGGLLVAYRDTPFYWPSIGSGWEALNSGGTLFLFRAGGTLFSSLNVLLLGMFAPALIVAWFAGAEKLARAAVSVWGPINLVFYPRINHLMATDRKGAEHAARWSAWLMMAAGTGMGLFLFAFAPPLVKLALGPGFEPAARVLRVMAVLPPMIALSNLLGAQWMLALRLDKELNFIILGAGLVNVAGALTLGRAFQPIGMAVSLVIAEMLVVVGAYLFLRRRKQDPWRGPVVEIAVTTPSFVEGAQSN